MKIAVVPKQHLNICHLQRKYREWYSLIKISLYCDTKPNYFNDALLVLCNVTDYGAKLKDFTTNLISELLPGPPQEVYVEALSDTELKIKWLPPNQNIPVEKFNINITLIKELSDLQEFESGMVISDSFVSRKINLKFQRI